MCVQENLGAEELWAKKPLEQANIVLFFITNPSIDHFGQQIIPYR
jgi:hypothetical protein